MPKEDAKKTANKNVNKTKKDKRHFFKDLKAELKRVIWSTPKQLINNTVAVITIVLITALIVFVLDFAFEKLNTYGIEKIKTAIESSNQVENETASEESTDTSNEVSNTDETTDDTTQDNITAEETTENIDDYTSEENTSSEETVNE